MKLVTAFHTLFQRLRLVMANIRAIKAEYDAAMDQHYELLRQRIGQMTPEQQSHFWDQVYPPREG